MDDLRNLAERLDFYADTGDMGRKPDPSSITRRSAKALREAAARIEALEQQLAGLKEEALPFVAIWAAEYARDHQLPDGALHAEHYDLLAKLGARLVDWKRHERKPHDQPAE